RRLAAHADEGDLLRAALDGLGVGHGVGAVGVAASGRLQDLLLRAGHAGDRLPRRPVALQVGDEGGVDVAVVEGPDEDGRHEAAVLAELEDLLVGRPGEDDVLGDALHLDGRTGPAEEELVDLGLPGPEPGAGPRARGAAPVAVPAPARAELLLEVERLVDVLGVLVAEDVMRAGHDAAGTARAQPAGHDLLVQVLPVQLLRRHARHPPSSWLQCGTARSADTL